MDFNFVRDLGLEMQKELFLILSVGLVFAYPDCYISIGSVALNGFVFRTMKTSNIKDCFERCKEEALCQSLNYYTSISSCELNNRTIAQKSSHFKKQANATYFENPYKVPLGSSASVPAFSCQQIKASITHDGFYWILDDAISKPIKRYCQIENYNNPCVKLLNGSFTGRYILENNVEVYCHSKWTLIGRFSNSDEKNWMRDDGSWWYDVFTAQGDVTSTSVNQDMISPAFWSVNGSEIKITRSDDPTNTALLRTTSNCLGSRTFRSMITSYGDFRNGTVWAKDKCLGSCSVVYGGQYWSTDGFSQARCGSNIQSSNRIGFWCHWKADGAVMMIGGGGSACARADHGIGITEENESDFATVEVECDFGDVLGTGSGICPNSPYAINLWIR